MDCDTAESSYQDEMCEKLIQLSFAKIVNSKTERGGAKLHKNLLILHLLQKARFEQRNRILYASSTTETTNEDESSASPRPVSVRGHDSGLSDEEPEWQSDMQADQQQRMEEAEGDEEDGDARTVEYRIQIDDQRLDTVTSDGNEEETLSTGFYDLASYLSSTAANGSPEESRFDDNGAIERTYTSTNDSHQLPPSWKANNTGITGDGQQQKQQTIFDFSSNEVDKTEGEPEVHQRGDDDEEDEEKELRRTTIVHESSTTTTSTHDDRACIALPGQRKRRCYPRHSSNQHNTESARSLSSSSDDSDGWSSSEEEENDGGVVISEEEAIETADHGSKRHCLKRKLDEAGSDQLPQSNQDTLSSCDWYFPPKIACLTRGSSVRAVSSNDHQNLNGLISVFQSAALTSTNESGNKNGSTNDGSDHDEQLAIAVAIYEDGEHDPTLTRSMSCPGLMMELTCES